MKDDARKSMIAMILISLFCYSCPYKQYKYNMLMADSISILSK